MFIRDDVEYTINLKKQIGYVGHQPWNCDLDRASLWIADEVENCKITPLVAILELVQRMLL